MVRISFIFEIKAGQLAKELRGEIDFDGEPFLGCCFQLPNDGNELRIIPVVQIEQKAEDYGAEEV